MHVDDKPDLQLEDRKACRMNVDGVVEQRPYPAMPEAHFTDHPLQLGAPSGFTLKTAPCGS